MSTPATLIRDTSAGDQGSAETFRWSRQAQSRPSFEAPPVEAALTGLGVNGSTMDREAAEAVDISGRCVCVQAAVTISGGPDASAQVSKRVRLL